MTKLDRFQENLIHGLLAMLVSSGTRKGIWGYVLKTETFREKFEVFFQKVFSGLFFQIIFSSSYFLMIVKKLGRKLFWWWTKWFEEFFLKKTRIPLLWEAFFVKKSCQIILKKFRASEIFNKKTVISLFTHLKPVFLIKKRKSLLLTRNSFYQPILRESMMMTKNRNTWQTSVAKVYDLKGKKKIDSFWWFV